MKRAKSTGSTIILATMFCCAVARVSQAARFEAPKMAKDAPIQWGASCEAPEGAGLSFGGQDRNAPDGRPHTRMKREGQWAPIHKDLHARNPLQARSWICRRGRGACT